MVRIPLRGPARRMKWLQSYVGAAFEHLRSTVA